MTEERKRTTAALYNEAGVHIGYLHLPTGQVTTPKGNWSDPSLGRRTGRPSKAHQARLDAAARLEKES